MCYMELQEFMSYVHTHLQKEKLESLQTISCSGTAIKFIRVSQVVNYSQQFCPVPSTDYPLSPSPPYMPGPLIFCSCDFLSCEKGHGKVSYEIQKL